MSGAWPVCTSTAFTEGWYIRMVERMDATEQRRVHDLEERVKTLERRLEREDMPNGYRRRLKEQLDATMQRLQETVEFYGGRQR